MDIAEIIDQDIDMFYGYDDNLLDDDSLQEVIAEWLRKSTVEVLE